jgi:hypothetical protein
VHVLTVDTPVYAAHADEEVTACTSVEVIGTHTSGERVVTGAAVEIVIPLSTEDRVRTR